MRQKSFVALLVCFSLAAFLANGCIFDSATKINNDNTDVQIPDLEDEWGGYKPTDEAPAFGSPEILSEFSEDQDVVDLLETDPQIAEAIEDSLVEVYFLRITWGNLQWDTTVSVVTDWSGSAQINKGTLVLLRTIRFERGDYIHRPRPDRQTLEWSSYTGPHFDGVYVAVVVRPDDTTSTEGTLTFSTTPFSRTFTFSELDSINAIYQVDQQGNEIAFVGYKKQLAPCGNGFLEGRWTRTSRHMGFVMGRWINRDGSLAGHFMGYWGIRRDGQKLFFGKCISHNGEFRWLIRARWGYRHGQDEDKGWFAGEYFDRSLQDRGAFKGEWRAGGDRGRKGFFEGAWHQFCPYGNP